MVALLFESSHNHYDTLLCHVAKLMLLTGKAVQAR